MAPQLEAPDRSYYCSDFIGSMRNRFPFETRLGIRARRRNAVALKQTMQSPLGIIAEITHRCPLHCVYCSNPIELTHRQEEMSAADWTSVFEQAGKLGALQVFLTGGEPLARSDLTELVRAARKAKLYTNLITSGIGLSSERLKELIAAGLDHIQLSFQGAEAEAADEIAGARVHTRKLAIGREITKENIGFTVNAVVHRQNVDQLPAIVAMAEELGAQKLEIAHVQYYGWAFENRARLLPTREQVEESLATIEEAQQRLAGKLRIEYVLPDYYATYPKPCMGGWGQAMMVIAPDGRALPCHAANVIPDLRFANVREHPLRWIWEESPSFALFRGEDWMQPPCRTCDRRARDFGGCRCQAFLITGDAAATDPVCTFSPHRARVMQIVEQAAGDEWKYRRDAAAL
jgi:pyrroloquinoline quinone biosynthesis protein E